MKHKDKIYCALDFTNLITALRFVEKISSHIGGIKVGLEFFMKNGFDGVKKISESGLPIFLDLKLNDIPNTVKKAAENLFELSPEFLSVHINGGIEMLREIISIKKKTKILGVSMLTSLDNSDLKSFGLNINSKEYVENLFKIGLDAGIDGIVCSAHEVPSLKNILKNQKFVFVTPGIRLQNDSINDQKRIVTPGNAIKLGSSILIVGRSITQSDNPIEKIKQIYESIEVELAS